MAIEAKRGCGFRKVGGLYLVSDGIMAVCDRLPLEIGACPVCGEGLHVTRGTRAIQPRALWGDHQPCTESNPEYCAVCRPPAGTHYLMGVGKRYYPTPADFIAEGIAQGVSKRISAIPTGFKAGESFIYLTHPIAVEIKPAPDVVQMAMEIAAGAAGDGYQPRLVDAPLAPEYRPGVFAAFRCKRIEKLIWKSEATEETIKELVKRGITPVIIPDGDRDHM